MVSSQLFDLLRESRPDQSMLASGSEVLPEDSRDLSWDELEDSRDLSWDQLEDSRDLSWDELDVAQRKDRSAETSERSN